LSQVWVDANFKEVQLRNIRIGQPVKLTADVYGKRVEYTGVVAGMGAGTGAAFALLPAQNATGNWIKVVQRVPVRIALNKEEVAANPLRVGLSMDVEVDIANRDGKSLADVSAPAHTAQTEVYSAIDAGADAEVKRVINANLGGRRATTFAKATSVPKSVSKG
jgi:membrane fusion protein (multidrug efflux system)